MRRFNLTTIRPKGFPHSSAFAEVKSSVAWSLAQLGHEATETENWISAEETNIIFGAELLTPNQPAALPLGTIVYNLEQPTHPNLAKVQDIVLRNRCTVWDYSLQNVKRWEELGAEVKHVPIGYTPNLTRIPKAEIQDIDVLFLGWITPRREKIVADLREAGLKVVASQNCYGGGRDNLIARAKVCLNVHHDGRNLFEIVRVSYYLANSKCVVSEASEDDLDYADLFGYNPDRAHPPGLYCMVPESAIVDSCRTLAGMSTSERRLFEEAGFRDFSNRDFAATVRAALAEPSPFERVERRYTRGCESGDMKDFMSFLREKAKGTCLEIGVRDGASTSALLKGVQEKGGVVLSVDVQDCSKLFENHPQWKFIASSSQNPKLKVPELDLLLIDGDHTREGFRADLTRFFPLVKPGGLILSHDIDPNPELTLEAMPGSDRPSKFLYDEFLDFANAHQLQHYEVPGENGLGVMIVPQPVESDESWQASEALLHVGA